jgi:hypothetical protein
LHKGQPQGQLAVAKLVEQVPALARRLAVAKLVEQVRALAALPRGLAAAKAVEQVRALPLRLAKVVDPEEPPSLVQQGLLGLVEGVPAWRPSVCRKPHKTLLRCHSGNRNVHIRSSTPPALVLGESCMPLTQTLESIPVSGFGKQHSVGKQKRQTGRMPLSAVFRATSRWR